MGKSDKPGKLDLKKIAKSSSGRKLKKNKKYYTSSDNDKKTEEKNVYDGSVILSDEEHVEGSTSGSESDESDTSAGLEDPKLRRSGSDLSPKSKDRPQDVCIKSTCKASYVASSSSSKGSSTMENEESKCCGCKLPMDGAHGCAVDDCENQLHPFCGNPCIDDDGDDIEGYGSSSVCPDCFEKGRHIEKNIKCRKRTVNTNEIREKVTDDSKLPDKPEKPITKRKSSSTENEVQPKEKVSKTSSTTPENKSSNDTENSAVQKIDYNVLEPILNHPSLKPLFDKLETYIESKVDEMIERVEKKIGRCSAPQAISALKQPEGFPLETMEQFNDFEHDPKKQATLKAHLLAWGYDDPEKAAAEYLKKAISEQLLFEKFEWIKPKNDSKLIFGSNLEHIIHSSLKSTAKNLDSESYLDIMRDVVKNAKQRHREFLKKQKDGKKSMSDREKILKSVAARKE